MAKFKCERCGWEDFTITRQPGMLCVKCKRCGEEYWSYLPDGQDPSRAPEEGE